MALELHGVGTEGAEDGTEISNVRRHRVKVACKQQRAAHSLEAFGVTVVMFLHSKQGEVPEIHHK